MAYNFTGKRILVTGAGKGIGREIAIALAESGCHVLALSRTQADLDTLVEQYPTMTTIMADVSDWDATRSKLEQLGVMDGLVNNAGKGAGQVSFLETSPQLMKQTIDNNLMSTINCTQVIGKKMVAEGKPGSIVNISSVTGCAAVPFMPSYCLSKAGINMVTKQFALELGNNNISVNSVNPTLVITPFIQSLLDKGIPLDKEFIKQAPLGRCVTMTEVAKAVLYLLSDNATMVTGTHHVVDGGILSSIIVKGAGQVSCLETTPQLIQKTIDNNLMSTINCTQAIGTKMVTEGKPGSIVNISSIMGSAANNLMLAYGLSKDGVDMVTKQFALELGKHNIRVNLVSPTLVITPFVQSLLDKGIQKTLGSQSQHRWVVVP